MTTASDLLNDALLLAGVGSAEQAQDNPSFQNALRVANRLIDSWSNEYLLLFDVTPDSFTMTAAQASYSTSLLTQRPLRLDYAYLRQSNIDYPLELIGAKQYADISVKSQSSLPAKLYYNPDYPNGTLYFFPAPSTAYQCFIGYYPALPSFTDSTTVVSLPKGYERMIVSNLAVELAPYFGREVPASVGVMAIESKASIKRTNYPRDMLKVDTPVGQGLFNIYRGT